MVECFGEKEAVCKIERGRERERVREREREIECLRDTARERVRETERGAGREGEEEAERERDYSSPQFLSALSLVSRCVYETTSETLCVR